MKIKNKFKKLALASTALLISLPAYSISPAGAAGATAGALIGAYIIGKAVSVHHKHQHEDEQCDSCRAKKKQRVESETQNTESKKAMKQDLKKYKKDLSKHKSELRKVEKRDKKEAHKNKTKMMVSQEAANHKSMISKLEAIINDLKQRIKNMI